MPKTSAPAALERPRSAIIRFVDSASQRTPRAVEEVGRQLRRYADRGVFRGFSRHSGPGEREEFRFRWIADTTFRLRFDPRRGTLTFEDLLPGVPYPSAMDRAFRAFLEERASEELPEHRRIDPGRVALSCRNRRGSISVTLEIEDADYGYGVKKSVSLVNEIFHGFLRGPYHEYMVRNFDEPEE